MDSREAGGRADGRAVATAAASRPTDDPVLRRGLAMDHAAIGMAIQSVDGAYLDANESYCRMLGRTPEELQDLTWQAVTHPDDLADSRRMTQALVDGQLEHYRMLKRYLRADGSVLWGDVNVAAARDDDGRVAYFIVQVLDETERIQAEEALRLSEARYRTLVGEIDGVVFTKEADGSGAFCSGQVQRLLGFPPEAMVLPGVWRSLVVEEDLPRAIAQWEGDPERDGYDLEYRMRRADGAVIWVEERWRSIRDATGRIVRWCAVTTDVTARKRLDETVSRTDRLEAVSRVAAAAARDFGELLTEIQYAHVNLADAAPPDDPRADDLRAIGSAVRRGVQLTRQLLAFGRDREELEAAPLDVAWLLADMEPLLRGVAGTAELSITVAGNGLVRITRSALEQAILNLVINARDAMPSGGSIRITVARQALTLDRALGLQPGPYLILAVADTGTGMPIEVQERALEPFFTTKPHGTGIGLPSVYGTMLSVGGTVRIESLAGEGTTVTLLMPEAEPVAPALIG